MKIVSRKRVNENPIQEEDFGAKTLGAKNKVMSLKTNNARLVTQH